MVRGGHSVRAYLATISHLDFDYIRRQKTKSQVLLRTNELTVPNYMNINWAPFEVFAGHSDSIKPKILVGFVIGEREVWM